MLDGLWQVGLNTTGACGDVVRNVTGCPVAGVDADEIVDASPLVLEVSQLLAGNADFYNLPRKFKISITGCRVWCPYPEINDIGLTALTRVVGGQSRDRIFPASRRRAFDRTLSWGAPERICSLESGFAGGQRHC